MIDVFGLGELLWDVFPDRRLPGGAPANVAYHMQQFGLAAGVISRVGRDTLGDELVEFVSDHGLSTEFIQRDPDHATGRVDIDLTDPTQARYEFLSDCAWDHLAADKPLLEAISKARAICFGTLAQRHQVSRASLHECLSATSPDCLVVYDVNLRPPHWQADWVTASMARAKVIKLNDHEVQLLSQAFGWVARDGQSLDWQFAGRVLDHYPQVELVCITRGGAGCLLVGRNESSEQGGLAVDVVDTVGAGDAFSAAMIWGLLSRWPLGDLASLANATGALVASRAGAMPAISAELAQLKTFVHSRDPS